MPMDKRISTLVLSLFLWVWNWLGSLIQRLPWPSSSRWSRERMRWTKIKADDEAAAEGGNISPVNSLPTPDEKSEWLTSWYDRLDDNY